MIHFTSFAKSPVSMSFTVAVTVVLIVTFEADRDELELLLEELVLVDFSVEDAFVVECGLSGFSPASMAAAVGNKALN